MSAQVFLLPIIPRRSFDDPAWCEQHDREAHARRAMTEHAPPRTRPLLLLNADRARACVSARFDVRAQFDRDLSVLRDAFNVLPEG